MYDDTVLQGVIDQSSHRDTWNASSRYGSPPYYANADAVKHLAHDIRGLLALLQIQIDADGGNRLTSFDKTRAVMQRTIDRSVAYCSDLIRQPPADFVDDGAIRVDDLILDVLAVAAPLVELQGTTVKRLASDGEINAHHAISVHRILLNLVRNALHAMASVEDRQLKIEAAILRDKIRIDVVDTGPGLPEFVLQTLFPRFDRSASHPRVLGLGLPSSIALSKSIGGRLILLRSGPEGAAFRLEAPRALALRDLHDADRTPKRQPHNSVHDPLI